MEPTHGGKRPHAGRPAGQGKGRTVKTSSISLTPTEWAKLDAIRGGLSRSRWVAGKIKETLAQTERIGIVTPTRRMK